MQELVAERDAERGAGLLDDTRLAEGADRRRLGALEVGDRVVAEQLRGIGRRRQTFSPRAVPTK